MVHSVVTEIMLTAVVAAVVALLASSFYSNMSTFYDTFRVTVNSEREKMLADVKIVFAAATSPMEVKVWVKNTGYTSMSGDLIARSTLIFGPTSSCALVGYRSAAAPSWNYRLASDLDSDGVWDPSETLEIDVAWGGTLPQGDYYVKLVLYNGVSDEYYFSL